MHNSMTITILRINDAFLNEIVAHHTWIPAQNHSKEPPKTRANIAKYCFGNKLLNLQLIGCTYSQMVKYLVFQEGRFCLSSEKQSLFMPRLYLFVNKTCIQRNSANNDFCVNIWITQNTQFVLYVRHIESWAFAKLQLVHMAHRWESFNNEVQCNEFGCNV